MTVVHCCSGLSVLTYKTIIMIIAQNSFCFVETFILRTIVFPSYVGKIHFIICIQRRRKSQEKISFNSARPCVLMKLTAYGGGGASSGVILNHKIQNRKWW